MRRSHQSNTVGVVDSRRSQISRLRHVAVAALREYPLPPGRLSFVSHGENTTFKHDSPGGRFLVRVHRPMRHGRDVDAQAAIGSEIAWLRAIRADTALEVPQPLETRDGRVTVTATAGGQTRVVSVLRWLDGRIHETSARPTHLRRLGAALAVLHDHADGWRPPPGFVRIQWDHDGFFGNAMVYGGVPAAECWDLVPERLRERFQAVADRMLPIMSADRDIGLIHADPHLGNAVFAGDRVQLIDFDDCGTGPRIYDLAVALWELRDEPHYAESLEALLTGYTARRDVDLTHLDDFIAVRQVSFDLWYTGTAQINPQFASRLDVVHQWSADMLDLLEPSG